MTALNKPAGVLVFGEVLFDCFPTGEQVLGGAPFNVAWHLQALGDRPLFISRVGQDAQGKRILQAMQAWGMETRGMQIDQEHPTGRVKVCIIENEPSYDIVADSAYDFITADDMPPGCSQSILYHGTLALRHQESREALQQLAQQPATQIFLDVNLRSPWWTRETVMDLLQKAHWAKMNEHELELLTQQASDITQQMESLQRRCGLAELIVTRGERGALVRTAEGAIHTFKPDRIDQVVDTVGAGDAFSALYLHGLLAGWPIEEIGKRAQRFAGKVIGLRGAITTDPHFYRDV